MTFHDPVRRGTGSIDWVAVLVVLVVAWSLTTHGKYSVSGDEPHYLMVTRSLVADGDLELANNYAHNDARLFGRDGLEAGPHVASSRSGRQESVHDIGLPVLLAPIYAIAQSLAGITSESLLKRFRMDRGLFAYSLISLVLIGMTAIGVGLLARTLATSSSSTFASLLVIALGISPPILSHSFLVFPEVAALFITCVTVWFALKHDSPRDVLWFFAVLALLGALPWAHRKFSPYVLGLLFVILRGRWPVVRTLSPARWTIAAVLFLGPQIAFHAWTWSHWGNIGGPQMLDAAPFSLGALGDGLVGLWFDRQSGLLAYAPLYWMLAACWMLTWKRTWPFAVPVLLLYIPMAAFVEWWGGFAPAARYLVPVLPLCAVAMADAMRSPAVRVAAVVLFVPQALVNAIVWQRPRTLWPADARNAALDALGAVGRAYEAFLPAVRVEGLTWSASGAVVAMALMSVALVVWARRVGRGLRP